GMGILSVLPRLVIRRVSGAIAVKPRPEAGALGALQAFSAGLAFAMEEGEVLHGEELLRPERLALALLGREPGELVELFTLPSGERVLVRPGHLRDHLLWRIRNLPPPNRLHLATTTASLTMSITHPVQAFLRAKVGRVEIIMAAPRGDLVAYLQTAVQAMMKPHHLEVEGPGGWWHVASWQEALEALT
ncbi:MAG: hypothetical protein ACK4NU_15020, partial [Brevundimonas sp.]